MANRRIAGALRTAACLAALAGLLLCAGCRVPWIGVSLHSGAQPPIRIGAPDGAGGLLVAYAAARIGISAGVVPGYTVTPIQDCCSSTAEWALSSQSVDAAVVCPDAAQALVQKDNRYTIVGPCLANSDLVVVREQAKTKKIGVAQHHQYQELIVKQVFGPQCQAVPMWPGSLPYAYEKDAVDGVVLDVSEGLRLPGVKLSSRAGNHDVVTYVLVTRKDYETVPELGQFVNSFREAAAELNDPARLQQAINSYNHYPANGWEAAQWMQLGIRFIPLKSSGNS